MTKAFIGRPTPPPRPPGRGAWRSIRRAPRRRGRSGWSDRNRGSGWRKPGLPTIAAEHRETAGYRPVAAGMIASIAAKMRKRGVEAGAQAAPGSRTAEAGQRAGERAQDRPVVARVPRREGGAVAELHAALGVDPRPGFFRVGGAGEDDVRAMRTGIAMRADDRRRTAPGRRHSISSAPSRNSRSRRLAAEPIISRRRSPPSPGTNPMSRPPTRDAAVWRTRGPIQSSLSAPTSAASRAAAESTGSPFAPTSAPCPTRISGRFAAFSASRRTRLPRR